MVAKNARFLRRANERAGVKRWSVAKRQDDCEDDRGIITANGRFLEHVKEELKEK